MVGNHSNDYEMVTDKSNNSNKKEDKLDFFWEEEGNRRRESWNKKTREIGDTNVSEIQYLVSCCYSIFMSLKLMWISVILE